MFDTREPKTGPSKAPKPKTPTPSTAPRPLKANQQRWERTFRGAAKGVTFQLRIIRRPDGHLSARYQATPGKGSGWHLEGQLRDDNTFTLKGTENKAEFQGKISPDGKTVISSFRNQTSAGAFQVPSLTLSAIPVSLPPTRIPATGATQTPSVEHAETAAHTAHIERSEVSQNVINALNSSNYTPKTMSKKDRHDVFFNIVKSFRGLGVPHPELIAAQWATESSWGKSHSGKNNVFGIKEFDPNKPRTFAPTKEWDPKLQKLVNKTEPFADYKDYADAFIARANFTIDNPRYAKAGYFEAKNLKEAAYAIDRAGYANTGNPGSYAESLISIMVGCGVDVERAGPAAAGAPRPQISAEGNLAAQPSASPDQLDRLINLKSYKKIYTIKEINLARSLISKLQDDKLKGDLFEILQTKTPYRNQRNNQSIGLQSDNWTYKGRDGKTHWVVYAGKPIGDIMCNLTSLTMVLETLGIENPSSGQYEDFLENVRRKNSLPPRTTEGGWAGVARQLRARKTMHKEKFRGDYAEWKEEILPYLRNGNGVMMSLNGHIVRLQSIANNGITVDDPYGRLPSLLNYSPNDVTGSYSGNLNSKTKEAGVGEDTVFPWNQVSKFTFHWIAAFERS
ncbi:glucosaminidase domain-containing protein [Deinococcus sp. UR1]|uniref:glucosaminidase domain-containing protein n=1 Tax=Deinococcus sp. UR1 TaxID=1704277 RepID=UPI000AADC8EC|nr:glucosaminidase domain-containing protein [Deinococcus sp. UR1]